jgi:hypothetical protein
MATGVVAVVMVYAMLIAHVTEDRTDVVRRAVMRRYDRFRWPLGRGSAAVVEPNAATQPAN